MGKNALICLWLFIVLRFVIVWAPLSEAATLYVDPTLSGGCMDTYDPPTRSCGRGSDSAHNTLAGAAAVAAAGDTVLIREGVYNEPLVPRNSGEPGNPLIFRSFSTEKVLVTGALRPAIDISNRQHIVIEGLEVSDVTRWLYAVNAHYNIIKGNTFKRATDPGHSSRTGLYFQDATYNKVLDNIIEDNTLDLLSFVNANRNLATGNILRKAHHALWTIRCGDYNVIRGNYLHNETQKIGEIYDCDNHAGYFDYNATKRNLIDSNDFACTPSSGDAAPYAGIQYAGQQGIIRRNRFYDTVGPGIQMALYEREARHNTDNYIYHNVFYNSDFAGVQIAKGDTLYGNVFKNNILAKNSFVANDRRWGWWVNTLDGKPVQVLAGRLDGYVFDTNGFFHTEPNEEWLITHGDRSSQWSSQHTVDWWEANYPELVRNSILQDPQFVDADGRDFRLSRGSPMIDAGAFLTLTTTAGSGKIMPVEDAGYFYDGFGVPGEVGDTVQLAGQSETATIVEIDYPASILVLDRPLSWSAGQGLHLAYMGKGPDVGAYEYGLSP